METYEITLRGDYRMGETNTVIWVNAPSEEHAEKFADMIGGRVTGCINSQGVDPEYGQVDFTIHK